MNNNQITINLINSILKLHFDDIYIVLHIMETFYEIIDHNSHLNLKCLNIDNDENKNIWRIHFVELKSEKDFYIEIVKTSNGEYSTTCFEYNNFEERGNDFKNCVLNG